MHITKNTPSSQWGMVVDVSVCRETLLYAHTHTHIHLCTSVFTRTLHLLVLTAKHPHKKRPHFKLVNAHTYTHTKHTSKNMHNTWQWQEMNERKKYFQVLQAALGNQKTQLIWQNCSLVTARMFCPKYIFCLSSTLITNPWIKQLQNGLTNTWSNHCNPKKFSRNGKVHYFD